MRVRSPRATALSWLLAASLLPACAAPPNREIADAQAALAVARTAGAERYAAKSYEAAAHAYKLANEAVMAGDYRLALNRAIESREQAQNAARESADLHARARDEVQRAMTDVATLQAEAAARAEAAERAGTSRRVVREAHQVMAEVNGDVQEAGAAIAAQDYAGAQPLLEAVKGRLQKVIASLDAARASQTKKPRS
jgi:hypothetical protein